jgi:hypothetical protein
MSVEQWFGRKCSVLMRCTPRNGCCGASRGCCDTRCSKGISLEMGADFGVEKRGGAGVSVFIILSSLAEGARCRNCVVLFADTVLERLQAMLSSWVAVSVDRLQSRLRGLELSRSSTSLC